MELDTNIEPKVTETETGAGTEPVEPDNKDNGASESAEIAKLKAELAKQKAALDKASSDVAVYKKRERAQMSEADKMKAEMAEAQENMKRELEQLRKEKAVSATTAKVLTLIGDNTVAGQLAEYLYGAEDSDAALDLLAKAWAAKEKALRLEFGKIPAPGTGSTDGTTVTRAQLDAMNYVERAKFMQEHTDEYRKLMGR